MENNITYVETKTFKLILIKYASIITFKSLINHTKGNINKLEKNNEYLFLVIQKNHF